MYSSAVLSSYLWNVANIQFARWKRWLLPSNLPLFPVLLVRSQSVVLHSYSAPDKKLLHLTKFCKVQSTSFLGTPGQTLYSVHVISPNLASHTSFLRLHSHWSQWKCWLVSAPVSTLGYTTTSQSPAGHQLLMTVHQVLRSGQFSTNVTFCSSNPYFLSFQLMPCVKNLTADELYYIHHFPLIFIASYFTIKKQSGWSSMTSIGK